MTYPTPRKIMIQNKKAGQKCGIVGTYITGIKTCSFWSFWVAVAEPLPQLPYCPCHQMSSPINTSPFVIQEVDVPTGHIPPELANTPGHPVAWFRSLWRCVPYICVNALRLALVPLVWTCKTGDTAYMYHTRFGVACRSLHTYTDGGAPPLML